MDAVLTSFNLSGNVYFLTGVQNNSVTAVANIFIDTCQFQNYIISALSNGLSDHDAQLFRINDTNLNI